MPAFHLLWTMGSYLLPFVFVLSLVVFCHEMGHFLVGRWCGVKVDAFSLGFGPEIAHYIDRHGTRWRLAALPLGGYVRFHGDANAASEPNFDANAAMPDSERAAAFFAQKVWKRAAVVAAGPIANFVLALVIFTGLFYFEGRPILAPRIETVIEGGRAAVAGFKKGDLVLSIDGVKVDGFADMQRIVSASGDTPLHFVVERDGKTVELDATPERKDTKTPFGVSRGGVLGVSAAGGAQNWRQQN
jgi:regulator of sigma E protease